MPARIGYRLFVVYAAAVYAGFLLVLCGVIPSWKIWYSESPFYREQVSAFLNGDLALSHNPVDLKMDLCWSEKGVQQVWGLGIPLWELPFNVLARVFGFPFFPDRIALGCFIALAACIIYRTSFGESGGWKKEKPSHLPILATSGALVSLLFFAPLINLLRSPMNHYEEPLVYVYFFGILLACGLIALLRRPSWGRFWLVCALSGVGGLIRPTLVLYGFVTFAMAGFLMLDYELRPLEGATKISRWGKFIRNPKFFLGLLLFAFGGGLLFVTNYLRFGSGWEFGHRLNVSTAIPSIYSTRFDFPFKHEPLPSAAGELFGALFLAHQFNGVAWYVQGIFPLQSHTIRKRGFDMITYDLSHAVVLALAWILALWLLGRWLNSRIVNKTAGQPTENLPLPGHLLLLIWSMSVSALLGFFFLRVPVISDRYMLDFAPAFALALVGLWWWCTEKIIQRSAHSKRIILFLLIALVGWQGLEIARGKSAFGSPRSITAVEIGGQIDQNPPAFIPLPKEYKIGDSMESWDILYNGAGWSSTDGKVWSCAIFYVEDPEFLELELAAEPNSHPTEASLTTIQAKVGREFLERSSITRTKEGWVLRFAKPKQSRYQTGVQPIYLAMVPSQELANYVIPPSPWILKRVSWRKK